MKKIKFVAVGKGDPFEYQPQLKTIWPEPYGSCAAEASRIDSGTGEIFYAMYYGLVIGITGVFTYPEAPNDVYLRWTGVIPEFRKSGIGRGIIQSIIQHCRNVFPDRERLIELVPDNEYGHTVPKPFFEKLGFAQEGATIPAGEAEDWPVLTYVLDLKAPYCTCGAKPEVAHSEACPVTHAVRRMFAESGESARCSTEDQQWKQ